MANLTQHLTSISPDLRSGSSPGRRLLALVLCSMLVIGSVFPGVALAREADSEGEGSSPSIELPEPPDFDPGGEETGLEEVPATGGDEEGGAVEIEPEVDIEVPSTEEVTGAAAEAPVEAPPPPPPVAPEAAPSPPEPQPVQEAASEPASPEPVANQSITAPKQAPAARPSASESSAPPEEAPPPEQEAPSSPQPVAAPPADAGRNLAGRGSYVVRPGDCLWHIAAGLLPTSAGDAQIAQEVQRIWRLNEDRIGTGDPNLLLVGTELELR
jgi:outer membrane biosynthesis protein TonB